MKKSISYNFDVDDAMQYGVEASVLLSNIRFWVFANQAKRRNFKDGKYWTYNSAETLTRLYPFWSRRKIARLLTKLEDAGAVVSDCHNANGYDQTKWYSIVNKSTVEHRDEHNEQQGTGPLDKIDQWPLDKSDQCPLDKSDQSSRHIKTTNRKPNKKVSDLDPKKETWAKLGDGFEPKLRDNWDFALAWIEWAEYRISKKKPLTPGAEKRMKINLNKYTVEQCLEAIDASIQSGWTGLFPKIGSGFKKKVNPGENIDLLM